MIGGTGWISSAAYYRLINEGINSRLGGEEFARCILFSLNSGEIKRLFQDHNEEGVYRMFETAAIRLVESGAEVLAICSNTGHIYYDRLIRAVNVPIVHIATATAMAILEKNIHKVGLMGTQKTMESVFYQGILEKSGITTIVPDMEERIFINEIIFSELFHEVFKESSRKRFIDIMQRLVSLGAEGIVLGCTEIPLLIRQSHTQIPLFDTLEIHANAIVNSAIEKE